MVSTRSQSRLSNSMASGDNAGGADAEVTSAAPAAARGAAAAADTATPRMRGRSAGSVKAATMAHRGRRAQALEAIAEEKTPGQQRHHEAPAGKAGEEQQQQQQAEAGEGRTTGSRPRHSRRGSVAERLLQRTAAGGKEPVQQQQQQQQQQAEEHQGSEAGQGSPAREEEGVELQEALLDQLAHAMFAALDDAFGGDARSAGGGSSESEGEGESEGGVQGGERAVENGSGSEEEVDERAQQQDQQQQQQQQAAEGDAVPRHLRWEPSLALPAPLTAAAAGGGSGMAALLARAEAAQRSLAQHFTLPPLDPRAAARAQRKAAPATGEAGAAPRPSSPLRSVMQPFDPPINECPHATQPYPIPPCSRQGLVRAASCGDNRGDQARPAPAAAQARPGSSGTVPPCHSLRGSSH